MALNALIVVYITFAVGVGVEQMKSGVDCGFYQEIAVVEGDSCSIVGPVQHRFVATPQILTDTQ